MPIVTIQVTREGTTPGAASVTSEQKAALIKGASQLLLDVLNKPREATFVVIEEVEMENWGWSGLPVADIEKRTQKHPAPEGFTAVQQILAGGSPPCCLASRPEPSAEFSVTLM